MLYDFNSLNATVFFLIGNSWVMTNVEEHNGWIYRLNVTMAALSG